MQKLLALLIVGAALCLACAVSAAPDPVTLCHRPPGHPEPSIRITVGGSSVPAHLAHGDFLPLACEDIDGCGPQNDGCGGTLDCGPCCLTCADAGYNCGGLDDGCGHMLACGQCTEGNKCVFNQCETAH